MVVERGSFTGAGEVLHLSQPSVSFRIRKLEEELGVELLERRGKEVVVTEEGKVVYSYGKRILRLRKDMIEVMDEGRGVFRGRVTVEASTIPGVYILPKVLKKFKEKYPEVKVGLRISRSEEVIKKIIEKEIEVGVVGEFIRDKRLRFEELVEDEVVLIVPVGHRFAKIGIVRLEELKGEEFLIREEGSGTRRNVEESLRKRGVEVEDLKVVCELGSTEAVKKGVACGLGISFVSKWAVKKEEEGICEIPIEGFKIKRFFYLVIHRNRRLSRSSKLFYDFCLKEGKKVLR